MDNENKKENKFKGVNYMVLRIGLMLDNKIVKLITTTDKQYINLKDDPELKGYCIIKAIINS